MFESNQFGKFAAQLSRAQEKALKEHYGLNADANLDLRRGARSLLGTLAGMALGHKLGNLGVKYRHRELQDSLKRAVQRNPWVLRDRVARKQLLQGLRMADNSAHAAKGALTMFGGITGGQLAGRKYSPDDANEIMVSKRYK